MNPRQPWIIYSSLFVVLIGAFLLYHFRYVPLQRKASASRFLRVLATAGEEIKAELLSVVPPLTNNVALAAQSDPTRPESRSTNWVENLARLAGRLRHVESVLEVKGESNAAAPASIKLILDREMEPPVWEIQARYPVAETNLMMRIRVATDAMIGATFQREEFDHVLILDKEKKVVYQRGGTDLRLSQFTSFTDSGTFQTNWSAGSGAEFVVFGQPLRVTLPLSDKANEMMLCGFVSADRFQRRSSEISFSLVIGVCSVVLLLILAWPFLDARVAPSIGPLRGFDLFSLVFSMLLGVWIVTFVFLLFVSYQQLEEGLDNDLKHIAERIDDDLHEELLLVAGQLNRLDERNAKGGVTTNEANIYANTNIFPEGSLRAPRSYPFFEMVFWTDARGQQVAKWTRKEATTRFIDVSSRDYFQRVIRDQTWRISETNPPLSIESIYSRNTGENMAVVAIRSRTNAIAALDVNFLSLNDGLLPAGFGFCIFDPDGKVLFHSDKSRNLRENFFAECNHHPRLHAVARSRSTGRFDVTYSGGEHSVYLMPIQNLPWTLAVFRDERFLQIGNLVVSSIALVYGLSGLMVSLIVYLLAARWASISARIVGVAGYWLAGCLIVLGVGAMVWARAYCSGAVAPFILVFAAILAAIPALILAPLIRLRRRKKRPKPQKNSSWARKLQARRRSERRQYVVALGAIVFFVSAVPAIVSFVCVFRSEIELLARRSQLHLARVEAERGDRIAALYSAAAGGSNVSNAHATSIWGNYHLSGRTLKTGVSPFEQPEGAYCESLVFGFPRIRSLYSELENDSLTYISSRAHDGAWEWKKPGFDRLTLELEKLGAARSPGTKALSISSTLPRFPKQWFWLALASASSFCLCGLCVWLVRRFMVDRPRARAAGAAVGKPQSRWFLLRRPLMFIVVLVGLYYFTTQRPLWENSLTLLTGFAAAITAFVNVIKLLSDKTRGSQATATSGSGSASK